MVAAGMTELAMRLGSFRLGRDGDGLALLAMGIVVFGLLIWALSPPGGSHSAKG
ncbi:MAG TPA: hypothetical protein VHD85_07375 [Terracidiphilus sp.]|nr:hypothetical protein [Terracidiphilus sp.]